MKIDEGWESGTQIDIAFNPKWACFGAIVYELGVAASAEFDSPQDMTDMVARWGATASLMESAGESGVHIWVRYAVWDKASFSDDKDVTGVMVSAVMSQDRMDARQFQISQSLNGDRTVGAAMPVRPKYVMVSSPWGDKIP